MKAKRVLTPVMLVALVATFFPVVVAAAPPQPSDASGDVVVWTINTGNNSRRNCDKIGGCNLDMLSKRVQLLDDCPDVVLAQEIRSRSNVIALKDELDEIGGECGVYRQYFYDEDPSDPNDTRIAKVAIAWRFDRFELAKTSNGGWDVLPHWEMWDRPGDTNNEPACDSHRTHTKDGELGGTARYLTAVKLVDKVHEGKELVAASIHWDGAMHIHCTEANIERFEADISARWNGLPVVMGGDHNRKAWPSKDWTTSRTEPGTKPWHDILTGRGYTDVIRSTYSNTSDENGDGNIDICEQYTSRIHLDHSKKVSNVCSHEYHGRIDYIWTRGLALVYAVTDKAHHGRHQSGNYYSDHRPVTARLSL